jgi:hypothetical protein
VSWNSASRGDKDCVWGKEGISGVNERTQRQVMIDGRVVPVLRHSTHDRAIAGVQSSMTWQPLSGVSDVGNSEPHSPTTITTCREALSAPRPGEYGGEGERGLPPLPLLI